MTEIANIKNNEQTLLYIITKNIHQEKPDYETIFKAINLKTFCEENKIRNLALTSSDHNQLN